MSYMLPHLRSGWAVDQCILSEEDRCVRPVLGFCFAPLTPTTSPFALLAQIVVRFGHDWDKTCMAMDEVLFSLAEVHTFIILVKENVSTFMVIDRT